MAIAQDMKNLGENIIASHDVRVKALGDLVTDTHETLKGFATDRKKVADTLKADLAKGERDRLKDFKAMMSGIEEYLVDVTKNVSNMIKAFRQEHKAMADELTAGLENGETERLKDFKRMMADIQKAIKEIETFTANKLKEFDDAHAEMSDEVKRELASYVQDMVKATKRLMGDIEARQEERNAEVADLLHEFQTERERMAANWQNLVATIAKKRGGQPVVSAGAEVKTVKEAVVGKGRDKKKPSKKSRSSKRKAPVGI